MGSGGTRRQGRSYALQAMYAADVSEDDDLDAAVAATWERLELEVSTEALQFACELVANVARNPDAIEALIEGASTNWRVDWMSRVDRNILRLAAAELRRGEVPPQVILNEAVELAKQFGADSSPAFVNGILDRIASDVASS